MAKTMIADLLAFRAEMLKKEGVNWGLATTPEEFRIDPNKKYTSNGFKVINLRVVLYNSCGGEVTYCVKGTVVLRDEPWATQFRIWTLDGRCDCVFGNHAKWDLMPVEERDRHKSPPWLHRRQNNIRLTAVDR